MMLLARCRRSIDRDSLKALVRLDHRGLATDSTAEVLGYEETTCGSESREGEQTGIIVHGLLGSARNWRGFSRKLAMSFAEKSGRPWKFWRVDQRCHGTSMGLRNLPQPSSVANSAADVGRFLDVKLGGRPLEALIGHSLGGKVVLDLLTQRRDTPPTKQAWILDSVVGAVKVGKDEPTDVSRVLDEVESIPLPVPSREWLYERLKSQGFSLGFRQWMGSNLTAKGTWTFDPSCAQALYNSYQKSQYWELIESPPENLSIHIVRAANSDRWSTKHWSRLEKTEAASEGLELHILPDAGHWLHADNPSGLRDMLMESLVV